MPIIVVITASQLEDNPVLKIHFYHIWGTPLSCTDTVLQRLPLFWTMISSMLVQKIALEVKDSVSL